MYSAHMGSARNQGTRLIGFVPFTFGGIVLEKIGDNVWAFLLFVLAAALAVLAHFMPDKDLMQFAGSIAMTGAAVFHSREKKDT